MDFKKYFSESQTVQISVVKIGNQKVTKSILNQMPVGRKIRYPFELDEVQILGFVNDKGLWIIYTTEGRVFKQSITWINDFLKTPADQHQISTIGKYIELGDEYAPYDSFNEMSEEHQQMFLQVRDSISLFFSVLKSHQIYI